jgi:phosphate starvation-inducible membrane PsiE
VSTLAPVLLLRRYQAAHKWDVVVFWTVVTFIPVIKLSQRLWGTMEYWVELALIFVLHLVLLTLVFSHFETDTRLPLILALPAVWIEITAILRVLNIRENRYRPK